MNRDEYKAALSDWVTLGTLDRCIAATLTMKQTSHFQKLDSQSASQNLRHFLRMLNRHFFGNASERFNKRFEVLPVLEFSEWQRMHYHLIIRCPEGISAERVEDFILAEWQNTRFGYKENDVKRVYSKHWLDYMFKNMLGRAEIDIENTFISR